MSCVERVRRASAVEFMIGLMSIHDLIEVIEIEESCGLSLWGWDSYHAELSRPESITLVARSYMARFRDEGAIEGFIVARLNADELHINNIGVRERARRKGIGGALLEAALHNGRRLGAQTAILEARAGNVAAQALYRRYGFGVCGRRRNYYRRPAEDALIMKAELRVAK
ncbi:MAG: ribosomal protein S18-alanine N-acetyltransferase [Pyrinomonadaceae bacterium]|nr:ribosomal protein S18-alanine N-acetyltransferase [Pyrinomonadaceae bacterium]